MEIRGHPGHYRGILVAGGISARIDGVDTGEDHVRIGARTDHGSLILRLARDGDFLSGNWILGARRGTFTAEKHPQRRHGSGSPDSSPGEPTAAGPVSTGRSSRLPHSDHDPS